MNTYIYVLRYPLQKALLKCPLRVSEVPVVRLIESIAQTSISKPFRIISCLFTLRLYIGRSIKGLVFFFAALTEVQVTVLSVLNLPRQRFPANCPIRHCYVGSPLLFASEILCDSPTYNKQRMNKKSLAVFPGNPKCTMTSCWMASLGFVYGMLLGNCGYQTDR